MNPPPETPFTPMPVVRGREQWIAQIRLASPLGPLHAVRTSAGLAGLWFEGQAHHPGVIAAPMAAQDPLFASLAAQLDAYWRAEVTDFDLPLDPQGTDFQQRVWSRLRLIRRGSTSSYGTLARELGLINAARAVGAAVGRNPLSIIVPCHRVLGSGGALTGYAGGLERKTALLRLECALTALLL
jgi:methylated-DNA-[protein]-cysteine S-methyltransferase